VSRRLYVLGAAVLAASLAGASLAAAEPTIIDRPIRFDA